MTKPINRKSDNGSVPGAMGKQSESTILSTHDETQLRAYMIYLDRGGEHGYDLNHWLQAQHEVREARRFESLEGDTDA